MNIKVEIEKGMQAYNEKKKFYDAFIRTPQIYKVRKYRFTYGFEKIIASLRLRLSNKFTNVVSETDSRNIYAMLVLGNSKLGSSKEEFPGIHKAFKYYIRAAKHGSSDAMMILANLYGGACEGFVINIKKMLYWHEEAAKMKVPEALINLGDMYCFGYDEIKVDAKKSSEYYMKLAQSKDRTKAVEGMDRLANMYRGHTGVERNMQGVIYWYEEAVNCGNSLEGLVQLGNMYYFKNEYMEQNISKAMYYYKRASKGDDPAYSREGLSRLGDIYSKGEYGIPLDGKNAVNYYEEVLKKEDIRNLSWDYALFRLGILYTNGCGEVEKNEEKAAEYFRKATGLTKVKKIL